MFAEGNFESKQYTFTVAAIPKGLETKYFFFFVYALHIFEEDKIKTVIEKSDFLSYLVLLSQDREKQCFKQCF